MLDSAKPVSTACPEFAARVRVNTEDLFRAARRQDIEMFRAGRGLHRQTVRGRDEHAPGRIRGNALAAGGDGLDAIRSNRDEPILLKPGDSCAGCRIEHAVLILIQTRNMAAGKSLGDAKGLEAVAIEAKQPVLRAGPQKADSILQQTQWHQIGQPFGLSIRLKTVLLCEANLRQPRTRQQNRQVPGRYPHTRSLW